MTKLPLLSTPNVCLLSQAKLANDRAVTLDVVLLQVVQQTSSLANHLLQTAAAVEILLVCLEVLGQVSDAVGQNSNLYLGRTCVTLVGSVLLDDVEFYFFLHGFFTFHCFYLRFTQQSVGERAAEQPRIRKPSSRIQRYYTTLFLVCKYFFKNFFTIFIYFYSIFPPSRTRREKKSPF